MRGDRPGYQSAVPMALGVVPPALDNDKATDVLSPPVREARLVTDGSSNEEKVP